MKDNKGFSLVELIVVIAIMSILAGVVTISLSSANGTYVKECAAHMKSQLNNARQMTMAKSRVSLKFYVDSNGAYYADMCVYGSDQVSVIDTTTTKLGRKSVVVQYTTNSSYAESSFTTLTASNPIEIEFDRSSGAVKNSSGCVKQIKVSKGSNTKKITIYPETGKVAVE